MTDGRDDNGKIARLRSQEMTPLIAPRGLKIIVLQTKSSRAVIHFEVGVMPICNLLRAANRTSPGYDIP